MAQIEYNNSITTLISDLESFADAVPEMGKQMLQAEADIVEPELRKALTSDGLVLSGRLKSSIGRSTRNKGMTVLIGPSGTHHMYATRAGKARLLRAGHLGYIHEYGAPRRNIRGRKWMSKTVQKSQAKALDAAEKVHDEYMKKHNL